MKAVQRLRKSLGFTLVELLVVLTLIGVLGSLAVPSLRSARINQNLGAAASDLMVDAQQARSQALRLNRRVIVEPISGTDWRTGWNVFVELGTDNSYTSGTDTLVFSKEALSSDVEIGTAPSGSESPAACPRFAFDADGFAATVGGTSNCTVVFRSTSISRERRVIMSRSGRVRVCDPSLGTSSTC